MYQKAVQEWSVRRLVKLTWRRVRASLAWLSFDEFARSQIKSIIWLNGLSGYADMCNVYGTLHGGCAAYLIDLYVLVPCSLGYVFSNYWLLCAIHFADAPRLPSSALALRKASTAQDRRRRWISFGISLPECKYLTLQLCIICRLIHWCSGTKLKFISTSIALGGRVMASRCEVRQTPPPFPPPWHTLSVDLGQGAREIAYISGSYQSQSRSRKREIKSKTMIDGCNIHVSLIYPISKHIPRCKQIHANFSRHDGIHDLFI